jgi:hypothetical protein
MASHDRVALLVTLLLAAKCPYIEGLDFFPEVRADLMAAGEIMFATFDGLQD